MNIIHLPFIANENGPRAQSDNPAAALFDLIRSHPQQARATMTLHPLLMQVAQAQAADMAARNFFGHVNPDGHGPNYRIRASGYPLPDYYNHADDANDVESIAGGQATPELVMEGWLQSVPHTAHVLGLVTEFAAQTMIGVGYAYKPQTTYWHYWVFLSAEPEA